MSTTNKDDEISPENIQYMMTQSSKDKMYFILSFAKNGVQIIHGDSDNTIELFLTQESAEEKAAQLAVEYVDTLFVVSQTLSSVIMQGIHWTK